MLRLIVVTPERPFIDEECLNVTVPGFLGNMQVLPGHAALLSELSAGLVTFQKSNQEFVQFMIGEGFVEVDHDQVNILCEQARFKNEVDHTFEENRLRELSTLDKSNDEREQEARIVELKRCAAKLSLFEKGNA